MRPSSRVRAKACVANRADVLSFARGRVGRQSSALSHRDQKVELHPLGLGTARAQVAEVVEVLLQQPPIRSAIDGSATASKRSLSRTQAASHAHSPTRCGKVKRHRTTSLWRSFPQIHRWNRVTKRPESPLSIERGTDSLATDAIFTPREIPIASPRPSCSTRATTLCAQHLVRTGSGV